MQVLNDVKSKKSVIVGIGVTGADKHLCAKRSQASGSPLYQSLAIGSEQRLIAAKPTATASGKDAARQFRPKL